MSWSDVYLFCFLVGFSMSVLSFLAGAVHLHLPIKWHIPFHVHHPAGGGLAKGGLAKGGAHLSWFNASTVLAFLAWFGGTGYILTNQTRLVALACLSFAVLAGLFAGWIVFRFMTRLLMSRQTQMNDWDYRHEGSIGTVSITIRPNNTGEVIFEQHGVRRSAGARSDDGSAIEKGAEVVISRYEKGIAYVKRWDEFTKTT
jgi:membrane protein implicated in regulation of membrane protease activity